MPRSRPRRAATSTNLQLKFLILQKSGSQRRFAKDARWSETRLSEIIHGRQEPPTPAEKRRLARLLEQPIDQLFPAQTIDA